MKRTFLMLVIGCFCLNAIGQRTIRGTVRDGSDNLSTLPGVSVTVKGTTKGTATDLNGVYSISVDDNAKELVFSFIGMQPQTVAIGNRNVIDVTLQLSSYQMDEVVISALNINRAAKSLTVAQQRVDAETLSEVRDKNLVSSLAGKVAGVQITPPGSATGSARIVIRGASSFSGTNQPLFVVDGMAIDNTDGSQGTHDRGGLDLGNGAADINADDIESIDVLKGPNAAALYGSRAANGVIIITTKKAKEGKFKVSVNSNTMFYYISQFPDFENAFGIGHVMNFIGGNNHVLVKEDPYGNLYPYPGIPDIAILMQSQSRSAGGPHLGQPYIGLDGKMYSYSPEPNNVYDFYKFAHILTNNISVEGGTVENNYRVSFTNMNSTDVVEKQNLVNKNNLALRFYNTLVKNLTLDSKVTMMYDDTKNRRYSNASNFNPLAIYTQMPRTISLEQLKHYKDDSGKELGKLDETHNPYWSINETSNNDRKTRVLANFDLSYQILPSLMAQVKYGKDFIYTKSYEFRNKGAIGTDEQKGYYRDRTENIDNDMYDFRLLYNERMNDFSVSAAFGGSRLDYFRYWNSAEIRSIKQAGWAHISNSDDYPSTDEATERKRVNSLLGFVSLGFKDWVFLDITGRNDWSSALPKANNSYFYPSFGFSWIPTEMAGISSSTFFGKIRGSFAQVGNDTSPYRLVPYYSYDSNNIYNNYKYATLPRTLPNSYLKPEKTISYEAGLDLRFFNSRILMDLTYYYQESSDQIITAQMASSSGYADRVYNSGTIRNSGVELMLRLIPVEVKDFSWEISTNFSKNTSKVLSMIEGVDELEVGSTRSIDGVRSVIKVGLPYNALKGTNWLTDQQGRLMVQEGNGEPVPQINQYIGNATPDFLLGISNRFRYKDFDVYVLIDSKKGGNLISATRLQGMRNSVFTGDEAAREGYWYRTLLMNDNGYPNLWDGYYWDNIYYYVPARYDDDMNTYQIVYNPETLLWEKALDENGNWIPDPDYSPEKCERFFLPQNVGYYGDRYANLACYDASFIKLRELSIGYNVPKKLLAKIKLTNARISAVGRNFWIIYQKTPKGLDPEAAINAGNGQGLEYGGLPPQTTFGFDIKVSF